MSSNYMQQPWHRDQYGTVLIQFVTAKEQYGLWVALLTPSFLHRRWKFRILGGGGSKV